MSDIPTLPPRRDRHWLEYVTTLAALVIAAISLWVAIGTEDANRKMVTASSLPILQVTSSDSDLSGNKIISFAVTNAGVGPALVESFEVFWKGKPIRTSRGLMQLCCGYKPRPGPSGWLNGTVSGTVIRAAETRIFLTFAQTTQSRAMWEALDKAADDLSYRACYCSVFGECWVNNFTGLKPPQVDKCPAPKVPYTE